MGDLYRGTWTCGSGERSIVDLEIYIGGVGIYMGTMGFRGDLGDLCSENFIVLL